MRIALKIDTASRTVSAADHSGNGCGYMIAAAELLTRHVSGRPLAALAGLSPDLLREIITGHIGILPIDRIECAAAAESSLRKAFADHHDRVTAATGTEALICTCFGVSEDRINEAIRGGAVTVDRITDTTNAGRGCGSCLPLLRDILATGTRDG